MTSKAATSPGFKITYRKVASSSLSLLVAHFQTVYEGEN